MFNLKTRRGRFMDSVRKGETEIVKKFIEHGYDPASHDNEAIVMAVEWGRTKIVEYLLRYYPRVDPTAQDNEAIVSAIGHGYMNIAKLLMQYPGVDITAQNENALFSAVAFGKDKVVKWLLDLGFDPAKNNNEAIVMLADMDNGGNFNYNKEGYLKTLKLLLKYYPKVNPAVNNNSVIVNAAYMRHSSIIKELLRYPKVDPSAQNNEAIINAVENENIESIKLLLKDPRVNPAAQNNKAIKLAAFKYKNLDIIKLLGSDPRVDINIIKVDFENDLEFSMKLYDYLKTNKRSKYFKQTLLPFGQLARRKKKGGNIVTDVPEHMNVYLSKFLYQD